MTRSDHDLRSNTKSTHHGVVRKGPVCPAEISAEVQRPASAEQGWPPSVQCLPQRHDDRGQQTLALGQTDETQRACGSEHASRFIEQDSDIRLAQQIKHVVYGGVLIERLPVS